MKNKNKITAVCYFISAICFFATAIIGRNYGLAPIGGCFIIIGIVNLKK